MNPCFLNATSRFAVSAFACLAFLMATGPARAQAWRFLPTINQAASWEDNALMSLDQPLTLYGSITTAALAVENKVPTAVFDFSGSAVHNLFNESNYNSTDFKTRLLVQKSTPRLDVTMQASGNYDTTRTSEITNYGVIDQKAVRHTAVSGTPGLSYRLSERDKVGASVGYSISRYDDASYTNYDVLNGQTQWTHRLTQSAESLLSLRARRYETQNNAKETTDSAGPTLGVNILFNKTLSARMMVGLEASRTERESLSNPAWQWSTVFSGGLDFKGVRDMLDIGASREQQPYGNGTSSLLTSLSLSETHAINERFLLTAGGRYALTDQSAHSTSMKQQIGGNMGAIYRIAPEADINATYRYRQESYHNTSRTAQDNTVMIGLLYKPFSGGAR